MVSPVSHDRSAHVPFNAVRQRVADRRAEAAAPPPEAAPARPAVPPPEDRPPETPPPAPPPRRQTVDHADVGPQLDLFA